MGKNVVVNEKNVVDFRTIDKEFLFKLGKVNYAKARQPIDKHVHEGMMEIVYIIKGEQVYNVENKDFEVKSGEVFLTFPDELHSSGLYPEDKAFFYYFIINLEKNINNLIGYNLEDRNHIVSLLNNPDKRVFKGCEEINILLDNLVESYYNDCLYKKTIIRNLVSQLILKTVECKTKELDYCIDKMSGILNYIEQNIYNEISISKLAEILGLSETRFKMNFKKYIGIPPHEYILRKKVETAKKLLVHQSNMSITDIAYKLCFSSSQYFSTVFKRFTFMNPKEFKALYKQKE